MLAFVTLALALSAGLDTIGLGIAAADLVQAGLLHTVLVSYGYYYAGAYVLNRATGRRLVLHLPTHWPWADAWKALHAVATSPPRTATP